MTEHDEIVMNLDINNLLKQIQERFYGRISCFMLTKHMFIAKKNINEWTLKETEEVFLEDFKGFYDFGGEETLDEIKKIISTNKKEMESLIKKHPSSLFKFAKTIEFPIIKGEGAYKSTKGFLDLILHVVPVCFGGMQPFNSRDAQELVFEIKTKKNLSDLGSIIRQIKEYEEYYDPFYLYGERAFKSDIIPRKKNVDHNGYRIREEYPKHKTHFCLLVNEIDATKYRFFKENGIPVFFTKNGGLQKTLDDKANVPG